MTSNKSHAFTLFTILAIISLTCSKTNAQSSCTSTLLSMSSCLNYITGNSTTPATSCCSALANVVQSQPQCLCSALGSGVASSLGVAINQTRALQLPNSCNVKTPPVSKCGGGGGAPASAPVGVTGDQSDGPSADVMPSGGAGTGTGSKTVPGTVSNDGSIAKSSLHYLLAFIMACTSVLAIF